jgi:hypothetical protein
MVLALDELARRVSVEHLVDQRAVDLKAQLLKLRRDLAREQRPRRLG